jgi:hypothetical protein
MGPIVSTPINDNYLNPLGWPPMSSKNLDRVRLAMTRQASFRQALTCRFVPPGVNTFAALSGQKEKQNDTAFP